VPPAKCQQGEAFCLPNQLATDYDIEALKGLVISYDDHLSNNPLSKIDSIQHRFVTQRFYGCEKEYASNKLQLLEDWHHM